MNASVIHIECYQQDAWKQIVTIEGEYTTLYVYRNVKTGEVEIVQSSDDTALRTTLSKLDSATLLTAFGEQQ